MTPLFISNIETGPNQQRKDIFEIYELDKIGYLQIMTDLSTFFSKEKKIIEINFIYNNSDLVFCQVFFKDKQDNFSCN